MSNLVKLTLWSNSRFSLVTLLYSLQQIGLPFAKGIHEHSWSNKGKLLCSFVVLKTQEQVM